MESFTLRYEPMENLPTKTKRIVFDTIEIKNVYLTLNLYLTLEISFPKLKLNLKRIEVMLD